MNMSIVINKSVRRDNVPEGVRYSDIDVGFLGETNGIAITDFDAVRASIINILSTRKGSRILRPNFGSDLDKFLFSQLSEEGGDMVMNSIKKILEQEVRIIVNSIAVFVDKENYQYVVSIFYTIPSMSSKQILLETTLGKNGISIN